jgi:histidine ammonia-lyase
VLINNDKILAVEFLAAAQAVDLSGRYKDLSPTGKATHDLIRALVPTLESDRFMSDDIELIATALSRGEFLEAARRTDVTLF